MSYDLNIEKVNKKELESLQSITGLTLSELYNNGFITYKNDEYEYNENVIFLENGIWSNSNILSKFLKEKGKNPENDECKIISRDIFNQMIIWLEKTIISELEKNIMTMDSYDMEKEYKLLKEMKDFRALLKENDEIIFTHNW